MNNILIVDDEYIFRNKIRSLTDYASFGFSVIGECTNGREAVDFIAKNDVNVVFTDVYMPEMDGIDLAEYIWQHYPKIAVVIFSNYSELDYVKRAFSTNIVDYLLKQDLTPRLMTELLNRIKTRYMDALNNDAFIAVKRMTKYRSSVIDAILGETGASMPHGGIVTVMHIKNQKLHMQFFSEDESMLMYQNISNTVANIIRDIDGYVIFSHDNSLICYLPFDPKLAETEIMNLLGGYFKQIGYAIYKLFNLSVFWGISRPSSADYSLHKCYLEAKQMLSESPISAKNTMRHNEISFNSLSSEQEMNLLMALSSQNAGKVNACLEDIFQTVDKQKSMDILIGDLVSVAMKFGADSNISGPEIEPLNSKTDYTVSQYLEWSKSIFGKICSLLSDASSNSGEASSNKYIQLAKEYIEKNFADNISRDSVAQHVHINKDYLTRLFKEETGDNILNYINKCRIDEAKRLLENGNVNMSILALKVGFSSRNYFSTVFRKYTGMSPEQYRAQCK